MGANMLEPLKKRNDLIGPKVVEALKKRHFEAYYISDSKDVAAKVLENLLKNLKMIK